MYANENREQKNERILPRMVGSEPDEIIVQKKMYVQTYKYTCNAGHSK